MKHKKVDYGYDDSPFEGVLVQLHKEPLAMLFFKYIKEKYVVVVLMCKVIAAAVAH